MMNIKCCYNKAKNKRTELTTGVSSGLFGEILVNVNLLEQRGWKPDGSRLKEEGGKKTDDSD